MQILDDKYPITASTQNTEYFFTSTGRTLYEEVVQYTYMPCWSGYNLSFGVVEPNGNINYSIETRNGDMDKILATVANTVVYFSSTYPNDDIITFGVDYVRHRLYRQMISKYFSDISNFYNIYGYRNDSWEKFQPNIEYELFKITIKDN